MDIHHDISIILQKINRHWDQVETGNHGVSRIDKDILLYEVRHLYERLIELDLDEPHIARATETIEPPTENLAKHTDVLQPFQFSEEDEKPEVKDFEIAEEAKENADTEIKSKTDTKTEASAEKNPILQAETKAQVKTPVFVESKTKPRNQKPVSTADKFAAHKTLADRFAHEDDKSFASRLKNNKLSDIKSAIGINDRFLFINEIFKGNQQKYQEAMATINTCQSYHEALLYIDKVKIENQIENNEALRILLDIVKRKYQ